jgi:hypothetical protein
MPADELARQVARQDPGRLVTVHESPARAVDAALATAPLVCVAGSIFVAGEVRERLQRRAILR